MRSKSLVRGAIGAVAGTESEYEAFLSSKLVRAEPRGFRTKHKISPVLFPWQREIVDWALQLGRAALFEECGLGKTLQQLEWARHVAAHTKRKVLILTPLAVANQTVREAAKLGVEIAYCRSQAEAESVEARLIVSNYDMLKTFRADWFGGIVLDESSILKAYSGKTKKALVQAFAGTEYRLACTATPAPNDHLELGNHSEFLGVMPSHEMIARWFINDTQAAGVYRLKGHAQEDFWRWMTSWAVCIGKPSDLGGFDDAGFVLPALTIKEHRVEADVIPEDAADGALFATGAPSATSIWSYKAATQSERCRLAAELVASDRSEPWIVWCDTNGEADILKELIPDAVEVRGSDSLDEKERKLCAFSDGSARVIITKCEIAGFGMNWQHCGRQVFCGFTYSYERIYQALRRSLRYGRSEPVSAHMIYSDSERNVVETIRRKEADHRRMQENMIGAMRKHGLTIREGLRVTIPPKDVRTGNGWTLVVGDCVAESKDVPTDSVDLSIFSPPFSNLYTYSDSMADMGNSLNNDEFFKHFSYLIPELLRMTKPGRLCVVHCKDLPRYMNRDGASAIYDFPGELVRTFEAAGWWFHSRVTIWKDPVLEAAKTNSYGLLHKSFYDRAEVVRQGLPDYLVVFRKWVPEMPDGQVKQRRKPGDYIGENPPTAYKTDRDYSIQVWQRYASPVWFDVRQTNVLNVSMAREDKDEKHQCPLQLDVIAKCVDLWTNPGDLVFSPFAGIGSEGYQALVMGRRFYGIELKPAYADEAQRNLSSVSTQASLFATAEQTA